jgi:hypothetical protein
MSSLVEAVERLSIVVVDLVLVPILTFRGIGRALRGARTRSTPAGAHAGPASRPSARPKKTSTA